MAQDGKKKNKVSKGALSKKRRKVKAAERAECVQDKIENKAQRHARSQAVKVSDDSGDGILGRGRSTRACLLPGGLSCTAAEADCYSECSLNPLAPILA